MSGAGDALMAGLFAGLGAWGDKKMEEKKALRQQAFTQKEAELKAAADERRLLLEKQLAVPGIETIETTDENGRTVKRAIRQVFNPQTRSYDQQTIGEAVQPLEAPKTRDFVVGDQKVTQSFDPKTGTWSEIGRGRAFAPQQPRSPTEMESKIALAKAAGATPAELKALALGSAGADRGADWDVKDTQEGMVRVNKKTGVQEALKDENGNPVRKALQPAEKKQVDVSRQKLASLDAIEAQLSNVQKHFDTLKGSWSAGPGGSLLPTESGKQLDASVAALGPLMRQLTRVPGEGSTSDMETKLQEAAKINRGDYESVTQQKIDEARQLINNMRYGHQLTLKSYGQDFDPGSNDGGKRSGADQKAGASADSPIDISDPAEADKLPPGTFVRLNGRVGRTH